MYIRTYYVLVTSHFIWQTCKQESQHDDVIWYSLFVNISDIILFISNKKRQRTNS